MNTSCDNPIFWRECLDKVTRLGIHDGQHHRRPRTTGELVSLLTREVPVFYSRNGQQKALRHAYGAAYAGMDIARRAAEVAK